MCFCVSCNYFYAHSSNIFVTTSQCVVAFLQLLFYCNSGAAIQKKIIINNNKYNLFNVLLCSGYSVQRIFGAHHQGSNEQNKVGAGDTYMYSVTEITCTYIFYGALNDTITGSMTLYR